MKNNLNHPIDIALHQKNDKYNDAGRDAQKKNKNLLEKKLDFVNNFLNGFKRMGDLNYDLKQIKRTNYPITLTPSKATWEEIAVHARLRQRLSTSTIRKHLSYARFMETHDVPVDFQNPTFKNFLQHIDYREQNGVGSAALRHEWDAMKMFLRAYGIPKWDYKPPSKQKPKMRILPLPPVVYQFIHHTYSDDPYTNALYQYIFTHSFTIGFRVPSEICEMTTDDVEIYPDGTGYITITETKKHKTKRNLFPRKQILSSPTHKSYYNWLRWRNKVSNELSGNALYLWRSGRPVTTRLLGHKLSQHGKKLWKHFQPYDMRHWCAIARLIETKVKTGNWDEFEVCDWLGHDDPKTTMAYIKYAKQYYRQASYNWIAAVLKFYKKQHIEEQNTATETLIKKPLFQLETTDTARYGSTGTTTFLQKEIQLRYSLKSLSWINSFYSLNFSFFFYIIVTNKNMRMVIGKGFLFFLILPVSLNAAILTSPIKDDMTNGATGEFFSTSRSVVIPVTIFPKMVECFTPVVPSSFKEVVI